MYLEHYLKTLNYENIPNFLIKYLILLILFFYHYSYKLLRSTISISYFKSHYNIKFKNYIKKVNQNYDLPFFISLVSKGITFPLFFL